MTEFVELPDFLVQNLTIGPLTVPFSLTELVLGLVLPALAVWTVLILVYRVIRKRVNRLHLEDFNPETFLKWSRRIMRLVLVFTVVVLIGRLLGAELMRGISRGMHILRQPFFTSGATQISVITLFLVVPVFYLAGWLSRLSRHLVEKNVLNHFQLDRSRYFSVVNVVRFLVLILTIIVGLSIIGINLSSLAVLFGLLGIGVGFGLQEVIGNMIAGVIIIFARPVKEGDRILVDGIEGTVQTIKLIHTIVETVTHETIIIPNSRITGSAMHNYSYDDARIVVCNSVQVGYDSDLDQVGEILIDLARRNPYATDAEEPSYRVWSFDDSGITVRICIWIADAVNRVAAFSWTNLEIWRAFRRHGIEIPFPQVDLHVKKNPPATNEATAKERAGRSGREFVPCQKPLNFLLILVEDILQGNIFKIINNMFRSVLPDRIDKTPLFPATGIPTGMVATDRTGSQVQPLINRQKNVFNGYLIRRFFQKKTASRTANRPDNAVLLQLEKNLLQKFRRNIFIGRNLFDRARLTLIGCCEVGHRPQRISALRCDSHDGSIE